MLIDAKLAKLLSSYTLDISKAFFIAAFITPQFSNVDFLSGLFNLTRNIADAILFLVVSWNFAKMEK